MNKSEVNKLIFLLDEEAQRCRLAKRRFSVAGRECEYWDGQLKALAYAVIQINQAEKNALAQEEQK